MHIHKILPYEPFPTTQQWDTADRLLYLTKDTFAERLIHNLAKKVVSGYDRHSLGAILADDRTIQDMYPLFDKYPDANIIQAGKEVNLYDEHAREMVRAARTQEGVSLISLRKGVPYLIENGLHVPEASLQNVIDAYPANNQEELFETMGINKKAGGKTLAFLKFSMDYPSIALVRIDGQKYMLKAGNKYDLERQMSEEPLLQESPIVPLSAYSVVK